MKITSRTLAAVALVATLPMVASAAPLRTVVYRVEADARGSRGSFGGATSMGSGSASGKITVEVIQATQDEGLVVDVTEWIDRADRPMQKIRCALYGRTMDTICDQNVGATPEETVLLAYLGRFFYDPTKVDAQGKWHVTPRVRNERTIDNNLTVVKTDGDLVTINVDRREQGVGYINVTSGSLVYDSSVDVPTSINVTSRTNASNRLDDLNVRLTLTSDSMKAAGSTNSH